MWRSCGEMQSFEELELIRPCLRIIAALVIFHVKQTAANLAPTLLTRFAFNMSTCVEVALMSGRRVHLDMADDASLDSLLQRAQAALGVGGRFAAVNAAGKRLDGWTRR